MLSSFVERIDAAYLRLGHTLGWRFLASPARTLSPATPLAFIGLNPGGSRYHPPLASVEEGNAYRVERWGPGGTLTRLQIQMGRMYEEIAGRCSAGSPAELMDATLAGNFCPFRSPDWARLPNRNRSIEFSHALWVDVFEVVRPRALVCFGEVEAHIEQILRHHGARQLRASAACPVGWGSVAARLTTFGSLTRQTLVVRLPHLSRFGIFGRRASRDAVDRITAAIADAIRG